MVIQKASIGFKKYSDAKFEQKASDIFNSMDKNVNFPSPEPVATLVQDAVLRYTAALLAASSLDRNSVAEKNESRRSLQDMLVPVLVLLHTVFSAGGASVISYW